MPRPIVFAFDGTELSFEMNKVDRSKLYGYKELEVVDDSGVPCELATLADDGRTLVGKGGTGLGYLSADGNWCDKDELAPVDLNGEEITPVKSSFSKPIPLADEVTTEEFLDHSIRLIYELELPDTPDDDVLISKLRDGAIFKFDYSYRGGLDWDAGFLIANAEDEIFMLIGDETKIAYVGLQQVAATAVDEDESDEQESDLMDFGMI